MEQAPVSHEIPGGSREELKDELLRTALSEIVAGREPAAAAVLARLTDGLLDLDQRPEDLTHHIFASALSRRLAEPPPGMSLYLRRFDLSQISLFNLLAEHLPLVGLAGGVANQVLGSLVEPGRPLALLDVGIGTGQQEIGLIRWLADEERLPSELRLIAVEPSETSLREAERAVGAEAAAAGVPLEFTGIRCLAEDMGRAEWTAIRSTAAERPLLANAAFAAHHIRGRGVAGPARARERFLAEVAAVDPVAVVLVEPNSDHHEPDLARRFEQCLWHFGTVYRLIDRLPVDERDRGAMKLFFAREIDDILANAEEARTERHEPVERWLGRMEAAGLRPATGFDGVAGRHRHGVAVQARPGYAGVTVDGRLLVAVLCAAPAPLELQLAAPRARDSAVGMRAVSAAAALRVRDVMATDVPCVRLGTATSVAADLVWRTGASDLAVLDATGRFAGVLSEGDLLRRLLPDAGGASRSVTEAFDLMVLNGHHAAPQPIDELVIRDPVVLAPTDDLLLVVREMVGRQIRRLPVVTDDAELVGTISRADLARALLGGG